MAPEGAVYLFLAALVGLLTYGIVRHATLWMIGKPHDQNVLRDLPQRLRNVLRLGLAQDKVRRDRYAGVMHWCIFSSIVVLTLVTAQVASNGDVAALLESGWVTMDVVPMIPVVRQKPASVIYGPLAETPMDPDVVLLRVTGRQLMVLSDALPGLRIEGKPQCHIIAAAKEQGDVVASVGCQLSRARTGMSNGEMTCAIPATRLPEVIERLQKTARADNAVARYAAEDARRFA